MADADEGPICLGGWSSGLGSLQVEWPWVTRIAPWLLPKLCISLINRKYFICVPKL